MKKDTEEREDNKREVCGENSQKSRSVIRVTDSVTGGKKMERKKTQTEREWADCCQMMTATANNQPITVRCGLFSPLLSTSV